MAKNRRQVCYSEIDQIIDKEAFVASVEEGFSKVKDPRAADNQGYPLVSLLVLILARVMAGANTISEIHQYVELKIPLFRDLLGISNTNYKK